MPVARDLERSPRGSYARSAAVQERILDAATDEFAVGGFHSTTLKQIAERAGISERGLVYHFRSKESLLIAVLDRHEQHRGLAFGTFEDPLHGLATALRVVSADQTMPGIVGLHCMISAEATANDHPAHVHYAHRYTQFRRFLAQTFEDLGRQGYLRVPASPTLLAASFTALLDGLQLQWLLDRSVDVDNAIGAVLAAILTDSAMSQLSGLLDAGFTR